MKFSVGTFLSIRSIGNVDGCPQAEGLSVLQFRRNKLIPLWKSNPLSY